MNNPERKPRISSLVVLLLPMIAGFAVVVGLGIVNRYGRLRILDLFIVIVVTVSVSVGFSAVAALLRIYWARLESPDYRTRNFSSNFQKGDCPTIELDISWPIADGFRAWAMTIIGLWYYKTHRHSEAIIWLSRTLDNVTDDMNRSSVYFYLGNVLSEDDQHRKAVDAYGLSLEHYPNCIGNYYNRGIAFVELGEFDAAIKDFKKAVELNPKYDRAWLNLGATYGITGDVGAAEAAFEQVQILMKRTSTVLKNNLAYLHVLKGEWDLAEEQWLQVINEIPTFDVSYVGLALTLHKQGRLKDAVSMYQRAEELDPSWREVRIVSKGYWTAEMVQTIQELLSERYRFRRRQARTANTQKAIFTQSRRIRK